MIKVTPPTNPKIARSFNPPIQLGETLDLKTECHGCHQKAHRVSIRDGRITSLTCIYCGADIYPDVV